MSPRKAKAGQLTLDWDAPVASQAGPQTAQPASQGTGAGPAATQATGQTVQPSGQPLRQPWHPWYMRWWQVQPRSVQCLEQARLDREAAESPDHHYIREFLLERAARFEEESKSCSAAS